MRQMLKNMIQPLHALNKLKPLKICLIALTLLSVSCGKAPAFPVKTIWEVSLKFNACGEYALVDIENMKYKHVKDWPLEKCEGVFGFQKADIPKVTRWGMQTRDYVKDHCE